MGASIRRWTKQMKTIIDIVYNSNVHLTADEIYVEARKVLPNISLGTVYRNLNKLKAQGMVSEVPKGPLNTYAKHPDSNAHFECEKCHRLYCIPMDMSVYDLSRKSGFQVNRCSLNMSGICKECEEKASED
ncbi:Fur family transcriptional regulator [Methanomassiliicoccus luminyensis]|jgi:Fur family peroxide stress response transcriptional regulator|uniref:Fur family transcriptional regulator n=1 Tax=Methanomassiliicoccus luminyensis TaxID=1080712 RepID=UPI00036AF965|nr:transcriptional repressor [Methanomassiliicoccus luminyensis]